MKNYNNRIILPNYNEKLTGLDFLRALAILLVFFFHYRNIVLPETVEQLKDFGWIGVDLFFVLSGYLIANQLFKEAITNNSISLKTFFIKRIFRILPAYLFVVGLYFLMPSFRERETISPLWRFLSFTQNIGLDAEKYGSFTHAWSLCIEEQFYLTFPVILTLLIYFKEQKKVFLVIGILLLFTFFIRLFIWHSFIIPMEDAEEEISSFWLTQIYYPTHTRLDGILIGILIAAIFNYLPKLKEALLKYQFFNFCIGLILLVYAFFLCEDRFSYNANIFGFSLIAIGFGFWVLAALNPKSFFNKIKSPIISSLATLSYSIYLCHKGIVHLSRNYFKTKGVDDEGYLMLVISFVLSVLAALAIRVIIEKPFLKWRTKFIK